MNKFVVPLCWVFGIVFLAIGVLGFILPSPLLGYFEVDTVHNVVHILSGVLALGAAASGYAYSRLYLIAFGLVYGVVTILGFTMGGSILNLFMVNDADNYLHLVIAAVCLIIGFGSGKAMSAAAPKMGM